MSKLAPVVSDLTRKALLAAVLLYATLCFAQQDYPNRPIRLIEIGRAHV